MVNTSVKAVIKMVITWIILLAIEILYKGNKTIFKAV